MNVPSWYVKSGTIDFDKFEAQALSYRRELVSAGKLLLVENMSEQWAACNEPNWAATGFFTVEVDGRPYGPAFFLDPTFSTKELGEVAKLLGNLPGWSKWYFFTSKHGSLGGETPLEALKAGKHDIVKRAARAFAER
ncbi:hypothetical protein [Paraburkholderia azotifigens]|uniref:Uncharacterized protein n=1 Tax=Paraburkholderia azotifigens TaxID=2057004 RepID=A0A5C6V7R1_9BURK|nr:hypothetical protein [Paraburkholderia azotifigens]TXC80591.1 hypothetical protein FRZ40_40755 [Paraburkholderia azotifigens]